MIILNIGIGDGPVDRMPFENDYDLIEFIFEIRFDNCVWLVSSNCDINPCLLVHEDMSLIREFTEKMLLDSDYVDNLELHLHQYDSYEDAFKVATYFFEANPLCHPKD